MNDTYSATTWTQSAWSEPWAEWNLLARPWLLLSLMAALSLAVPVMMTMMMVVVVVVLQSSSWSHHLVVLRASFQFSKVQLLTPLWQPLSLCWILRYTLETDRLIVRFWTRQALVEKEEDSMCSWFPILATVILVHLNKTRVVSTDALDDGEIAWHYQIHRGHTRIFPHHLQLQPMTCSLVLCIR